MNKSLRKKVYPLFYIGLALFVFYYIIPIGMNIYYSFLSWGSEIYFMGFSNYSMLVQEEFFRESVLNTIIFIGMGVSGLILFSYTIAMLLVKFNDKLRILKLPYLVAVLCPTSAITFSWNIFFGEESLFAEKILKLSTYQNTYADLVPLVLLYIWKNAGLCIIIFIAGWTLIPNEIYEAGQLDGADKWKRFIYLTFPLMWQSIFFVFVLGIIQGLKIGRESFALYGEYPKESLYMIHNFYKMSFTKMNIGQMGSASTIFSSILIVVIIVVYKVLEKQEA